MLMFCCCQCCCHCGLSSCKTHSSRSLSVPPYGTAPVIFITHQLVFLWFAFFLFFFPRSRLDTIISGIVYCSSEEGPWSPSADSAVIPAGAEPPCPAEEDDINEEALDLREGKERPERMLLRGLRKLRYKPMTETDPDNPNVTKNLVSIIRMYSHSLVDVRLDWPKAEVYQALAECRHLTVSPKIQIALR